MSHENIDPIAEKLEEIFPRMKKQKAIHVLWIMPRHPLPAEKKEIEKIIGKEYVTYSPIINATCDDLMFFILSPQMGALKWFKDCKADIVFAFSPLLAPGKTIYKPIYKFLHICQQKPCPDFDPHRDWILHDHRHFRFLKFMKVTAKEIIGIVTEEI